MPAAGVKKIKFLTKSNLSEYIPEDQQLAIWGGKNINTNVNNKLLGGLGENFRILYPNFT